MVYSFSKAAPVVKRTNLDNIPTCTTTSSVPKPWEDSEINQMCNKAVHFIQDKDERKRLFKSWWLSSQREDPNDFVERNLWVVAQMVAPHSQEPVFKEAFISDNGSRPLDLQGTCSSDWLKFINSDDSLLFIPAIALYLSRYGVSQQATVNGNLRSDIYNQLSKMYFKFGVSDKPAFEVNPTISVALSKYYSPSTSFIKELLYFAVGTFITSTSDEVTCLLNYCIVNSFKFKGMYAFEVFGKVCSLMGVSQGKAISWVKHDSSETEALSLASAMDYFADTKDRKAFPWSRAFSQSYHPELSNQNMRFMIGIFTGMKCYLLSDYTPLQKFTVLTVGQTDEAARRGVRMVHFIRDKQNLEAGSSEFYRSAHNKEPISKDIEDQIQQNLKLGRERQATMGAHRFGPTPVVIGPKPNETQREPRASSQDSRHSNMTEYRPIATTQHTESDDEIPDC